MLESNCHFKLLSPIRVNKNCEFSHLVGEEGLIMGIMRRGRIPVWLLRDLFLHYPDFCDMDGFIWFLPRELDIWRREE